MSDLKPTLRQTRIAEQISEKVASLNGLAAMVPLSEGSLGVSHMIHFVSIRKRVTEVQYILTFYTDNGRGLVVFKTPDADTMAMMIGALQTILTW
jgi:hypothetical protein